MSKVLCFGSLNIDRVYKVDEIVREGETISAEELKIYPGGKGLNQSVALAKAGAQVSIAGGIGQDGKILIDTLNEAGVDTALLETRNCPTGHAIIQVNRQGQNCILISAGANYGNTLSSIQKIIEIFDVDDLLLLQNEIDLNESIIELAKARGMKIALNPSPMNEAIFSLPLSLVDIFLVNEHEAIALLDRYASTPDTKSLSFDEILMLLGDLFPNATIVLTLGEKGSACLVPGGEVFNQNVYPVKTVDTTAAGDTFTGYFLTALLKGEAISECLKQASMASSIAVSRPGAAPSIPERGEVMKALSSL